MTTTPALTSAEQSIVLYTKDEAAAILRVKVSWLERRAAARQIPFALLGGAYRFTPEHLAEIVRLSESDGRAMAPAPPRIERRGRRRRATSQQPADEFVPLRARPRAS